MYDGCWNYWLEPIQGMNVIVILTEDRGFCSNKEKQDLEKCDCPQVTSFSHNKNQSQI